MTETVNEIIKVTGLSCGHCAAAVEKAVLKIQGVKQAKVDLASGTLSVEFDPAQTNRVGIGKAVIGAGYGLG